MIELTIPCSAHSMRIANNVQSFTSELSGSDQFVELPGSRWVGSFTWAALRGLEARTMRGQLASLRGQVGVFKISPPDINQLGTALGNGVVAGSNAGSVLNTRGWQAGQQTLFEVGDYIEVNQELKVITRRALADASGNAQLHIEPPLRSTPSDGTAIITERPACYMRSANKTPASWALSLPQIYAFTLNAVESF